MAAKKKPIPTSAQRTLTALQHAALAETAKTQRPRRLTGNDARTVRSLVLRKLIDQVGRTAKDLEKAVYVLTPLGLAVLTWRIANPGRAKR